MGAGGFSYFREIRFQQQGLQKRYVISEGSPGKLHEHERSMALQNQVSSTKYLSNMY